MFLVMYDYLLKSTSYHAYRASQNHPVNYSRALLKAVK